MWFIAMEAWRARLANARATFLEGDEDDDVNIAMTLGQLESAVHVELQPPMSVIGGLSVGKAKNIERARAIMDERMHLDYFCDEPVWGLAFFRRRFRMKRSLLLTILERVCVRDSYFV
jgi:hypothetical protein